MYYTLIIILIVFICSLLNLIGLNSTITNALLFLSNVILYLIFGFKAGKKANSKGYLEGLKIGGLFLIILIIIAAITGNLKFRLVTLIYYLILILSSVFGGSIGINKKEESN